METDWTNNNAAVAVDAIARTWRESTGLYTGAVKAIKDFSIAGRSDARLFSGLINEPELSPKCGRIGPKLPMDVCLFLEGDRTASPVAAS